MKPRGAYMTSKRLTRLGACWRDARRLRANVRFQLHGDIWDRRNESEAEALAPASVSFS